MNRIYILITTALFFCIYSGDCQPVRNFRNEAQLLKKTILQHHVHPRNVNDQFSMWVYDSFLDELDPERLYFSEEDLKILSPFQSKLDEELNGTAWGFFPLALQTYKKCLARAENISAQILQTPFTFNVPESVSPDSLWAKNETEIKNRWRLALKHATISRLQEMRMLDAGSDDKTFFQKHEPLARTRVKAAVTRSIKRISNHASGFENHIASLYLQTIALAFDPHSAYFSPTAMENFLSSLSSEGYYFGFRLVENDRGEIVIEQLTPGGPAWKSGKLNSGDVIRSLRWDGKEEIDLSGVGMEEVNILLQETNHSSLELTINKLGGISEKIVLHKEKMEVEEGIVKSFVLQGRKKIGYISLPGFYTNWGEEGGARCANDVAKEIIKLKKEGIDGLILDLRFNGGGSLQEAVSMAGIFIDAGPIGIVANKTGEATTIKDINRGTVYDGPLVLMVNGMSASASEFLAAALQDYQRAIIVGSQTYGKATAQNLFPLDNGKPDATVSANLKPGIGYASVTFERIYRITGKTAQVRGVTPHIVLPDIYDSLAFREDVMELALPYDSITKKTYYQPLALLPIAELKHKSEQRLASHAGFKLLPGISEQLAATQHELRPVSLLWTDFNQQSQQWAKTLQVLEKPTLSTTFSVGHHSFEMQRMQMDTYIEDLNKAWIKKLQQDISLEEGFHIICEYIDILQRK